MELTAAQAYLQSLQDHIMYVQEAGIRLGVPFEMLKVHDQSKYSREEFMPYALNFFNQDGTPRDAARDVPFDEVPGTEIQIEYNFTLAWKHHLQNNDHHWQHWMFPDGYHKPLLVEIGSMTEDGVVKMPGICVLEMIADWMGASKAYTDSWDMSEWLENNMPRITLHPTTAEFLRATLIGKVDGSYRKVVDHTPFRHEI